MENNNDEYDLYSPGSSGWTSLRNQEFQESDIWEVLQGTDAPDSTARASSSDRQNPYFTSKRLSSSATATRTIPKSSKCSTSEEPKIIQQSAPVNIPDWSKIHGTSSSRRPSRKSCSWVSVDSDDDHSYESKDEYEDEEDQEGSNVIIPPHEWIARKVSTGEIYSFSVCEGAGRTLKGRDLSRVRNAVLTKTGFLETNSRQYRQ